MTRPIAAGANGAAIGARSSVIKHTLKTFTTSAVHGAKSPSTQSPSHTQIAATTQNNKFKYPSTLNIFHTGSLLTAYIGTSKFAGVIVFAQACLVQAPVIYLDSPDDFWWTPAAIALSSVPMILLQLMTGPFVNSVDVQLPESARLSPQALKDFSQRPDPDTKLSFTTLRFLPLPKRRAVRLQDLRILPKRMGGIANLEYLPPKLRQRCEEQHRQPGWFEGLIAGRRRFHVRPGDKYTKSTRGAGIWADLLRAIEQQGDKSVEAEVPTRFPAVQATNRRARRQASRQAKR